MAFGFDLDKTGDPCDKCRKPMDEHNPGVYMQARSRHENNTIMIHLDCLLQVVRKVERELAPKLAVSEAIGGQP